MRIELPQEVKEIIGALEVAGHEAYAVGGCVRDSILNRAPDDWDITTSAKPLQIKELFPKTIDTGIAHGTVTVMKGKKGYEVTTYRIDGEYEDGRHPKEVTFTSELLEDLRRRDFTINAMAYNDTRGLVDAFGGRQDMEKKLIRCVGEAACRFQEDALRMMRAVRFSAQLGYEIEEKTKEAIRSLAPTLQKISAERIQVELVKLLVSDHPMELRTAYELGMTAIFFPEFDQAMETKQNNPHHIYSVGEHILHSLEKIEKTKVLRLSMLLHDIAKPCCLTTDEQGIDHFYGHQKKGEIMAKTILKRLRFDNDTIQKVSKLVGSHDDRLSLQSEKLRLYIARFVPELFPSLLLVKKADMEAQSEYRITEKREYLEKVCKLYQEIMAQKDCLSLKQLAVTGKDLIRVGMAPGKELGEALDQLLLHVLKHPEANTKEELLAILQSKG